MSRVSSSRNSGSSTSMRPTRALSSAHSATARSAMARGWGPASFLPRAHASSHASSAFVKYLRVGLVHEDLFRTFFGLNARQRFRRDAQEELSQAQRGGQDSGCSGSRRHDHLLLRYGIRERRGCAFGQRDCRRRRVAGRGGDESVPP
jgi:hypothetical protein